jgi:hypothetical protein
MSGISQHEDLRSRLPTVVAIAAVLAVVASACNLWGEPGFFGIVNETDQDLVLVSSAQTETS